MDFKVTKNLSNAKGQILRKNNEFDDVVTGCILWNGRKQKTDCRVKEEMHRSVKKMKLSILKKLLILK